MFQTAAQHQNSIRIGSAKIEVGPTVDDLIDLGLAADVEFKESFTPIIFKPRNAPEEQVGVQDHVVSVKFNMWEIHLKKLYMLRGGMDSLTYSSLASQSVENELHTLNGVESTRLNNKNGEDTEVTIEKITTGLALLGTNSGQYILTADCMLFEMVKGLAVRDVDFLVTVDSGGYTRIARIAGSAILQDGITALVNYTYTPVANVKMTSGGFESISSRVVRLTNTNQDGKRFQITVYNAKNQGGIELKLPADDDDKTASVPIELKGVVDTTREAKDQLFEILDEQGVL